MRPLYSLLLIGLLTSQAQAAAAGHPISLTDVYRLAVANNAELAAAHAAYQARSENVPQARAGLLPQLGASASNTTSRTRVDTREYGALTAKRHSYSYQASLSQPLFRLDRWYQLKTAQADSEQAALELSATEQALILHSAEAYFAVLRSQDNLAASQAEEKAFQRQYDLARERFNVGLSDKTDMLQAQAAQDNARANRIQASQQVQDAFEALVTLTNHRLEALEGVRHSLPVAAPVPNEAAAWVDRALADNLQLRAMDFALQAAQQNLRTRKAGHLPTLDAVAQYQKGDNDSLGFANRGMPGYPAYNRHAEQTAIGLQLSIPLYTGGATSSQIRQGVHQLHHAQHSQENLRRQTVQAARSLHRAVNTDVEQVQARKQTIISSHSAVEATQAGYEVGTRTLVDVLDAQRQLYAAVRNYNNARYDYILNSLRLQQTAGSLSPDSLQALSEYLYADYHPERDFLPPDLEQATRNNLRKR